MSEPSNRWRRCEPCDVKWLSTDETCWLCDTPATNSTWPGMTPSDPMPDYRYPNTRRPA